jgi:uncharacterized protein (TIGR02646 family)
MIYIHKANLPEKMAEYYKEQINAKIIPIYEDEWGKEEFRKIVANEQSFICCYCMQTITTNNSTIEHFLPESLYKEEVANYYNLFLACNYSKGKQPKRNHHCDTSDGAKAEKIIPKYISHPKCETFFAYSKDGEILPYCNFKSIDSCIKNYKELTDEERMVLATIEVLKLNVNSLTQQRESFYQVFLSKIAAMTTETLLVELQTYYDKKDKLQSEKFCGMYFYLLRMQLERRGETKKYEEIVNKWIEKNKIGRTHTVITHKIEKEQ